MSSHLATTAIATRNGWPRRLLKPLLQAARLGVNRHDGCITYSVYGGNETRRQAMKKISLRDWMTATLERRQQWIDEGSMLNDQDRMVLGWALAFRDNGAEISDESIISLSEAKFPSLYRSAK